MWASPRLLSSCAEVSRWLPLPPLESPMRHRALVVLPLATLLVAPACASKPSAAAADSPAAVAAPVANTKADEDSIQAMGARMMSAMSARDSAAIGALYAADGVDFTPGTPVAEGRDAVVKEYAGMFGTMKDLKIAMQPATVSVAQSGDMAMSRAAYDLTWTDAKGKPAKDHGHVLIGWKKVDGAWKIATSMNASDVTTPGM